MPPGLNATEYTVLAGPVSGAAHGTGRAGSVAFHSRTVLSAPPIARIPPFGLKATEKTVSVSALSGRPSGTGRPRSATFQSLISEYSPAAAITRPLGVKATVSMTPGGPRIRVTAGVVYDSRRLDRASGVGETSYAASDNCIARFTSVLRS